MSIFYILQVILQAIMEILGRIDPELVAFAALLLNVYAMFFAMGSIVLVRHFTKLTTEEILALKY